ETSLRAALQLFSDDALVSTVPGSAGNKAARGQIHGVGSDDLILRRGRVGQCRTLRQNIEQQHGDGKIFHFSLVVSRDCSLSSKIRCDMPSWEEWICRRTGT